MSVDLKNAEKLIGYTFNDIKHLDIALTHKSYCNECMLDKPSYERYEFLGDAILEFISSEELFKKSPQMSEGELTKLRASLVCEYTLSQITKELGLGEYIKLSRGEILTGGRDRNSILCDIFESILGAIYLDGGLEPAKDYVRRLLLNDEVMNEKATFYDAKSRLQEYIQAEGGHVEYKIVSERGPQHNKTYVAAVFVNNKEMHHGEGATKKLAEQIAAHKTLKELGVS